MFALLATILLYLLAIGALFVGAALATKLGQRLVKKTIKLIVPKF